MTDNSNLHATPTRTHRRRTLGLLFSAVLATTLAASLPMLVMKPRPVTRTERDTGKGNASALQPAWVWVSLARMKARRSPTVVTVASSCWVIET